MIRNKTHSLCILVTVVLAYGAKLCITADATSYMAPLYRFVRASGFPLGFICTMRHPTERKRQG